MNSFKEKVVSVDGYLLPVIAKHHDASVSEIIIIVFAELFLLYREDGADLFLSDNIMHEGYISDYWVGITGATKKKIYDCFVAMDKYLFKSEVFTYRRKYSGSAEQGMYLFMVGRSEMSYSIIHNFTYEHRLMSVPGVHINTEMFKDRIFDESIEVDKYRTYVSDTDAKSNIYKMAAYSMTSESELDLVDSMLQAVEADDKEEGTLYSQYAEVIGMLVGFEFSKSNINNISEVMFFNRAYERLRDFSLDRNFDLSKHDQIGLARALGNMTDG